MTRVIFSLLFLSRFTSCVPDERAQHPCYIDGLSMGHSGALNCDRDWNTDVECSTHFRNGCIKANVIAYCRWGKVTALNGIPCMEPRTVDYASKAFYACCELCKRGIIQGISGHCPPYSGKYSISHRCCTKAKLGKRAAGAVNQNSTQCLLDRLRDATLTGCPIGYKMDEFMCVDVNECLWETPPCKKGEKCVNFDGYYDCISHQQEEAASSSLHEKCDGPHCPSGQSSQDFHYSGSRSARSKNVNPKQPNSKLMIESRLKTDNQSTHNCSKGFTFVKEENKCVDINECSLQSTSCKNNSTCINTEGGYECKCAVGFHSDSDGHCIEVKCPKGYAYNLTINECGDINECEHVLNPCGDHEKCINLRGSFKCVSSTCSPGYEPTDIGCKDVDECFKSLHNCTGERMECRNTYGSFKCDCIQGFEMAANNTCIDVDECILHYQCPFGQFCRNTFGSFTCECEKGLKLNEGACEDIDECKIQGICGNMECENTYGSYECLCDLVGYELSNGTCVDVNECEFGLVDPCGLQLCRNTEGSYECSDCPTNSKKMYRECVCENGYRKDKDKCVPIK